MDTTEDRVEELLSLSGTGVSDVLQSIMIRPDPQPELLWSTLPVGGGLKCMITARLMK